MERPLTQAYRIIFGHEPQPHLLEWQIAEMIMDNFNIQKLGEDLAKRCIFQTVNHVTYPNQAITTKIVGRAEGFATELWDDLPMEPHMAEIEYKEYKDQ